MVGPHTGGMRNAALEILVLRLGAPDKALLVSPGLPMGKTLQMQKGFWEWLRAYMDNGPWFDENGQRSDSDAYIKEMLKAANIKGTDWHSLALAKIAEKKSTNGGRTTWSGPMFSCWFGKYCLTQRTGYTSTPMESPNAARAVFSGFLLEHLLRKKLAHIPDLTAPEVVDWSKPLPPAQ